LETEFGFEPVKPLINAKRGDILRALIELK
jgi:hypothetical protein